MSGTSALEVCDMEEDPNQSLMRNMSSAIITGLRGKRFRSAIECVMESEANVLSFLQKSPLSALIEFHCVLLELSCDGYERTSHSRLLNPDGMPMYPMDTTMLSSTSISEADPGSGTVLPSITTGMTLLLSDHTSKTVTSPDRSSDVMGTLSFDTTDATVLSHIAEASLGIKTLGVPNEHHRSDGSTLGRASDVPNIIQELEHFCETTNERGLKCCLSAVDHLRTRLPRAARNASLRSNVISLASIWTTKEETPPQVQLELAPYGFHPSRPTVRLRITSLPIMSVTTQQDSKPRSITIRGLYVDISPPRPDQHAGGSPILHTNLPLAEDILRVVETVYRVIDRLSNGVTFAEQASVPARLSEAIFRVLRTGTCPGEVMKVVVQLDEAPVVEHPPLSTNPSVDSSASAGLRTDINPRASAGILPRGVTRTDGDSLTPPGVTPVEIDWWASNGMSPMDRPQFMAALASVQPGVLQGTGRRGVSLLYNGRIIINVDPALKFPELFDAAGLSALQIQVTWSPVSAFGALGFDAERIEDMCQMSAKNYAGRGFDTLRMLADELIASLPEQPHVHLHARIGRSSNNTPSVAPYTISRFSGLSIAVSERSSAKDLPVKIVLPRIYGFVVPERPTKSVVEVTLKGWLRDRPDLTGTVDMDVAAANSVKAVIESAAPIFSALGSAALDDHLAGRIANSLLHAEAVFPHQIRPEGVDVGIGIPGAWAALSTGSARVSLARDGQVQNLRDEPAPSLPAGTDTFHLQAETLPTGSQSHQKEAEDANDSTEPPGRAISQRETPSSGEWEEVTMPGGVRIRIPPILSSSNFRKRSGLSKVGCVVLQSTLGSDAIPTLSPQAIQQRIQSSLDAESGDGLEYLHNVAVAVCKGWPSSTNVTLVCKSPAPSRSRGTLPMRNSFEGSLDVFITTYAGAQQAGADSGGSMARLSFRQRLRTTRSTQDLQNWYQLAVVIDGSCTLSINGDDAKRSHSLAGMTRALRYTQDSMATYLDPRRPSDALVTRAADAIAHIPTLLPPNLTVQGVTMRIEECRMVRGKVNHIVLGRGEWRASGDRQTRSGRIFVALGSNVGDRLRSIETACNAIDKEPNIRVVQTSSLYETEPMYVQDQERFLNGVCEIETALRPMDLLDKLQAIELDMGRVKTVDKGPRSIDLDLLLYKGDCVTTDRLTVPHALMWEREFVLRPLRDVLTNHSQGAVNPRSVSDSLKQVEHKPLNMFSQVPLGPESAVIRANDPKRPTRVMSILNVTPDSFSDGGKNDPTDDEALKATILSHIASGATIIDVGGQSSRPNAPDITADEELARILPAIAAIKSLPEATHIAISIDTYRAAVASAAVEAGAHIINDISAGTLDPDMLPTIARLGCTYVMMHMRGTPATMQDPENLAYPFGLMNTICVELRARLDAAQAAGIRRWRIILDPGIGFAKTPEQNVEILRDLPALVGYRGLENIPWMVGSSRKGFIGKITGVEAAKERLWGTAATVTAAVQGGASVVRVHDVGEMAQVVKMADAMYRV
ncbi:trifunctional dihydropteroate synthetase [Friedmanniomyces endolithicus]|nr:trifunctional dihydropteroate synthetase [Friedmanniomyces endolithicus]KAK1006980.1 trifunctional dihydropteroate synthetase [Friedmanniomyces endolithicus]